MVIIYIDGIDECFDNMPAEIWIIAVSGCELMQEEQDPVLVHELGLGETEGFDRNAEVFGIVFQILQHGGGGSIPDAGSNGIIDVPDLLFRFMIFRFHPDKGEC